MVNTPERTVWMRRYTLDPTLVDQFLEFLDTQVFPARTRRGFTIEAVWLSVGNQQLTWFVSYPGDSAAFAAAEQEWEDSEERAEIFAGAPQYVLDKDLQEVTAQL